MLQTRPPRGPFPARSTGCASFSRQGVVPTTRPRRPMGQPGQPTRQRLAPHEVWSAAVKGPVNTGDGLSGEPLTVAEGYRRVLLGCHARAATRVAAAKPVCTRLCTACGVPQRLRPAHGVLCAPTTLSRRSHRAAGGVRLGSRPEGIAPGTPQPNGRPERRPRPLPADTTRPPALGGLRRARVRASVQSATARGRTRRSPCAHPPPARHPPPGRGLTTCPRSSRLTASRCATSAPLGASGGTLMGATSHTSASETMSASRTLTRGSGRCTSDPAHSGGDSHAIGASQMPMGDCNDAGDGDPCLRTMV